MLAQKQDMIESLCYIPSASTLCANCCFSMLRRDRCEFDALRVGSGGKGEVGIGGGLSISVRLGLHPHVMQRQKRLGAIVPSVSEV